MQNSKQNTKYEITDIAHWRYPFLHRIRALRDIGNKIKAGDLGGFVESEQNLSFEPGDEAWLFDDSICCNEARVDKNSILKDEAVVSGRAYITGGSSLSCTVKATDSAYICSARLSFGCMVLGKAMIVPSHKTGRAPMLGGDIVIYGVVSGDVRVAGKLVVMENEKIQNSTLDTLNIVSGHRTITPDESRGTLRSLSRQSVRNNVRSNNIVSMAR